MIFWVDACLHVDILDVSKLSEMRGCALLMNSRDLAGCGLLPFRANKHQQIANEQKICLSCIENEFCVCPCVSAANGQQSCTRAPNHQLRFPQNGLAETVAARNCSNKWVAWKIWATNAAHQHFDSPPPTLSPFQLYTMFLSGREVFWTWVLKIKACGWQSLSQIEWDYHSYR